MRRVVGQSVRGAVRGGLRRSGGSQQGGLVEGSLGEDGGRRGEGGVGGGGGQTCRHRETGQSGLVSLRGECRHRCCWRKRRSTADRALL